MVAQANGNVRISTEIETAGFQESLNRLEAIFNDFANKMSSQAKKISDDTNKQLSNFEKVQDAYKKMSAAGNEFLKSFKAVGVVMAGVGVSFAAMAKSAIASADRVDEVSKKLGISTERFSKLDYVAKQAGTSIESFGTSMRIIAQNVSSGSDIYKQLGVEIKNANGALKTQDEILLETISSLQKMPAGTQKSALAIKALGRNAQQMNEILNMSEDQFQSLMDRADKLGLVLSGDAADAAATFTDRMDDLSMSFSAALRRAIEPLLPKLTEVVEKFTEMLEPGGKVSEALDKIAKFGLKVIEVLPKVIEAFAWLIDNGEKIILAITGVKVALQALTGNWIGAIATAIAGIFSALLVGKISETRIEIEKTTEALRDMGAEIDNGVGRASKIIEIPKSFSYLTKGINDATEEIKQLESELAVLSFDTTIKSSKEFEERSDAIKSKIADAQARIVMFNEELAKLRDEQDAVVEDNSFIDYWQKIQDEAAAAEEELIQFKAKIAATMKDGIFNANELLPADRAVFDDLVKQYEITAQRVKSVSEVINEEVGSVSYFDKLNEEYQKAERDLIEFKARVAATMEGGIFDEKALLESDRAVFNDLVSAYEEAGRRIESVSNAIKTEVEEIAETQVDVSPFEALQEELSKAHDELLNFKTRVAATMKDGLFDEKQLTESARSEFEELTKAYERIAEKIKSINGEIEESAETTYFQKLKDEYAKAEEDLIEFKAIMSDTMAGGIFNESLLSDADRQKFDELVRVYKEYGEKIESITKDTAKEISKKVDISDTIQSAWRNIASAFSTGIESFMSMVVQSSVNMSDIMGSLAETMANTLSAVGDALIQAGLAEKVADALTTISPETAIATGVAIKLAAGLIKGMLANIKNNAGSFATGGIVGGSSYSGDNMIARVNSGEMILNRNQQSALWDFIRAGSVGGLGGINVEVINNAGVDIQTEPSLSGRSMRILINKQIERYLGSPAGGRVMQRGYGARQLGRR